MNKKYIWLFVILASAALSGCVKDDGPFVISVEKTPVKTQTDGGSQPSATPSPEPTRDTATETPPKKEELTYIEELPADGDTDTVYYGKWSLSGKQTPFNINGQAYIKGLGMFVKSKKIDGTSGSITFGWDLDKDYHKISFDLGCEKNLQYGPSEKYGTYRITVLADSAEIWDSGEHDYLYTAIDKTVELPDDTKRLEIRLTETKGENGTLNVVMGSFKLYYYD